jgi:hypothetical protein
MPPKGSGVPAGLPRWSLRSNARVAFRKPTPSAARFSVDYGKKVKFLWFLHDFLPLD